MFSRAAWGFPAGSRMRGRKPKPTHLHAVENTLNVTRHAERAHEPVAEGQLFEPPDWLTDGQQLGWTYAIANAPAGVLKRIDRAVLAIWVVAESLHREACVMQARLDAGTRLPLLMKTKGGQPMQSPYLAVINRQALIMLKAASELGFSPAARPRLARGESAPNDDAAAAYLD